jgi:hypothetical protein
VSSGPCRLDSGLRGPSVQRPAHESRRFLLQTTSKGPRPVRAINFGSRSPCCIQKITSRLIRIRLRWRAAFITAP